MKSMNWLVFITFIMYATESKFVDNDPHQLDLQDHEIRQINLEDNEILESFQTQQFELRYKTQQKYKSVPIFGATLIIEQDRYNPSKKNPVEGKWYDKTDIDLLVPTIEPEFDEDRAFQIALNEINIESNHVHPKRTSKLYIYYHQSFPYLCWIVKFSYLNPSTQEIHHPMVIINALNEDIFQIYDQAYNVIEARGTGGNVKTGSYSMRELINDNINPVLENDVIQVYDNHNYPYYTNSYATKITCSNLTQPTNNYSFTQCDIDDAPKNGAFCPACDAFFFANVAFEMFDEWTNATYPIWPAFIPMKIFVHVGSWLNGNWSNAAYEFLTGELNFGDGGSIAYPLTVLDIVAHEIAHGYTDQGSYLIYAYESGGMNEAFSDLAGEAAEYWLYGTNDWKVGADMMKHGDALRYMYDPTLDNVSIDHYSDYDGQNVHYTSGLYNKAAYNLQSNASWTMEQIFRVFAWANLFYWTPDSTFSEGINGLHRALYDLYDDNITDVKHMSDDLKYAFSDVGLRKVNATMNTDGILCGVRNKFCYYPNISASRYTITNQTVHIQADDDDSMTFFYIYFTVNDNECINPTLSFKYELIDYDYLTEYIDIYDNDDILINRCQNGQSCGVFDSSCINNYDLGSSIKQGETYKITVFESAEVDALCNTQQTINAFVTLQCNPTKHTQKINCGVNTFCYIVDVYPSITKEVKTTVVIQNSEISDHFKNKNKIDTYFNVFFIIHENDCIYPRISFEYELIDYNLPSEYIDLFDNNDNLITRCQGGYLCNQLDICLSDYDLGIYKIIANEEHYQIKIMQSYSVDSQCYPFHNDSIYAKLKFTCDDPANLITTTTTTTPTQIPIGRKILCGYNRWCYYIPVIPNAQNNTNWNVSIQNEARGWNKKYFDIFFMIENYTCVNPQLSFIYELIDYYLSYQYIDVKMYDTILIERCGAGDLPNSCNNYSTCLSQRNLGLTQIDKGNIFKLSLTESAYVDAMCSHSFSINAVATLHCGGTPAPIPPGEKVLCGVNRYCYTLPIYPSCEKDTEFVVNISHHDDNVETYFDVYFIPIGYDCINPSISYVFEEIDFGSSTYEYIDVFDDDIFIQRCIGNEDSNCGHFIQCLNDYDLQIDSIEMNNSYKISITESSQVDALCGDNSINSQLTIKCSNNDTFDFNAISTTMDIISTTELHDLPINITTAALCEVDKCYYETVTEEITTTTIENHDNIDISLINIYYTFKQFHCDKPRLTFKYEKVDVDRASEYIRIKVNDKFIADCGSGSNQCGQIQTCFDNKPLDEIGITNPIYIGQILQVNILISKDTNALCETYNNSIYTINADLTLQCTQIAINNSNAYAVSNNKRYTISNLKTVINLKNPMSIIIWIIIILLFVCILLCITVFCWRRRKHKIVSINEEESEEDNEISENGDDPELELRHVKI